ncbi:unnamed protein product [Spirodela intermedia]|uniref:Uncharacterized protein n=1 Tax=Spirodela intermedia TaxID=51605 RepID=A0A7I8IQE4_SPIIN|nr:unnamed protein product [Spirodela intermedia]CAA6659351.1 unnamed protein product [Spirodela intermedia]
MLSRNFYDLLPKKLLLDLSNHKQEFKHFSTFLPKISGEVMEQTYLKGFKLEIQSKLSRTKPMGLLKIIDASLEAEEHMHLVCSMTYEFT